MTRETALILCIFAQWLWHTAGGSQTRMNEMVITNKQFLSCTCSLLTWKKQYLALALIFLRPVWCFPGGASGKKSTCQCPRQETWVWSWVRKILWRKKWHPTPVFLPGKCHRQRKLEGYSPWGYKELDMTEHLSHTWYFNNKINVEFLYFWTIGKMIVTKSWMLLLTLYKPPDLIGSNLKTSSSNVFLSSLAKDGALIWSYFFFFLMRKWLWFCLLGVLQLRSYVLLTTEIIGYPQHLVPDLTKYIMVERIADAFSGEWASD